MKKIQDIKSQLDNYQLKMLGRLEEILLSHKKIAVAYSGGVDSTFLLKASMDILGGSVIAVTIQSELHSEKEIVEALKTAEDLGADYTRIEMNVIDSEEISNNVKERCYHCKKEVFRKIIDFAGSRGINRVADGTNADDTGEHRPGVKALEELSVISPLKEAGLGKKEIRNMSKLLGLETWDKPANPCLATRFPYNTRLTIEAVKQVDEAEEFIRGLGFKNVRVRYHGEVARIEVDRERISEITVEDLSGKIQEKLKNIGFRYITVDLGGFRSGSMD